MPPGIPTARTEREKKLKALLSFASNLTQRFHSPHDATLLDDLEAHIQNLPLQPSSSVLAKQCELDRSGTELWNLSTRLRRSESQDNGHTQEEMNRRNQTLCLLRVFAFLLLDLAGDQPSRGRESKTCIRLMKVALKAARACIESKNLRSATKVLGRAADYQDTLGKDADRERNKEAGIGVRLCAEYFAVRMTLAWREDRMDTAEHMFARLTQLHSTIPPSIAESLADLLYEIGKELLRKKNYELAVRWLKRAFDVIADQELELLSTEAGELRLSIMQSIVQAYMKLNTPDTRKKAWDMVKMLEYDYADKLVVSLLKLELLSTEETIDSGQCYSVLLQMIRSVVLNESNFKTIMHHIHKLKEHNATTSCKVLDDLIEIRLFREENQAWIERAVITRIWIATTSSFLADCLDSLKELFETVQQNTKHPFSAPATHAAQTLLWKRVEAAFNQEHNAVTESWCRICLHPLFDKAGEMNKSKISRKIISCASARQDYPAAREAFSRMSETGRDEPITRYLMYKVALCGGDPDFIAECLDIVCRQSSKDPTLLYACVMEAQNSGDKQQEIVALQTVLKKYNHSAPSGVHLPALLRCTLRSLKSELVDDGNLSLDVLDQLCALFEGACGQAKASRRRPCTPAQKAFTPPEFEWFSKNAYNLSLRYCAEMPPRSLARLLRTCIEFIKLLQESDRSENHADLPLRLLFCDFLAACTLTTLARAEDNLQTCLQHYLEARKHCQEFRNIAAKEIQSEKRGVSSNTDIISKHFQIVKLELEAVLKLERWDNLDELFEECWKYKNPDHYETLADLVLVAHSCIVKANLDEKYQRNILKVLEKIINLTWRDKGNDLAKLSRWIRCLFQLALTFDESISFSCLKQAAEIAARRYQTPDRYPTVELEWLVTTSFNLGVDYYVNENDDMAKMWAEKALSLTEWAEDGGALKDSLMEKYSKLVWQD